MTAILSAFASHGLLGLVVALLIAWLWYKDKELAAERAARIADAKAYTELALKLQSTTIETANKLTTVFEALQRGRYGGPPRG